MISRYALSLIEIYGYLIFAYIIMSWFLQSVSSSIFFEIYRFLETICEPYIGLFRRIIPRTGAFDFSPFVAYLVLQMLIRPVVYGLLSSMGL